MAVLTLARRCRFLVALGCGFVALPPAAGRIAPPNAAQVKAELLYNFASFVEWPDALAPAQPLVVCVAGDDAVAAALRDMPALPDGQTLETWILEDGTDPRRCRVVYLAAIGDRAAGALLARLDRAPVLTVGDSERFIGLGGMIRLYAEGERMRFEVHLGHAADARLRISSRVLNLASSVREPDAERH